MSKVVYGVVLDQLINEDHTQTQLPELTPIERFQSYIQNFSLKQFFTSWFDSIKSAIHQIFHLDSLQNRIQNIYSRLFITEEPTIELSECIVIDSNTIIGRTKTRLLIDGE